MERLLRFVALYICNIRIPFAYKTHFNIFFQSHPKLNEINHWARQQYQMHMAARLSFY